MCHCLLCSVHFIFTYLQEGKIMPVKYEENSLIWVAVDQPVKDNSFLSSRILELCGDLPIFWLKPTYPRGDILNSLTAAGEAPHLRELLGAPPQWEPIRVGTPASCIPCRFYLGHFPFFLLSSICTFQFYIFFHSYGTESRD